MNQCLESKAAPAWPTPARSEDIAPHPAASRATGRPGVIRSALQYLAKAAADLEEMLFPVRSLPSRQPHLAPKRRIHMASEPRVRHDRKDAVAEDDVERNAPLIREAVHDWLKAQKPGAPATGARMFCAGESGQWTAETAQLADLVVADCGPRLAQLARAIVADAGASIELAAGAPGVDQQQKILADILAGAIGQTKPKGDQGLLSPALAGFLGTLRKDVQQWTSHHVATDWQTVGLAGPNVVGNVLFACGMRSVVEQLRREAQGKPPTPKSRYNIQGSGGPARTSEATLYEWLEKMCLDIGHGQREVAKSRYDISTAACLAGRAYRAVQRFSAAMAYNQDLKNLQAPGFTSRLVRPGKPAVTSPVGSPVVCHPLAVTSPSKSDSERTPESQRRELTAEDFAAQ